MSNLFLIKVRRQRQRSGERITFSRQLCLPWKLCLPFQGNCACLFFYKKKIDLKCILGLNVKSKTIKLLEENIGEKNVVTLGLGKDFLDITPKAQSIKEEIAKMDSIKIKTFILQKALLRGWKEKPPSGRISLWSLCLMRYSYPEYVKNSQSPTIRKNLFFSTGKKIWMHSSPKKTYGW